MNHDPRRFGGDEYAPQPAMRPAPDNWAPEPSMRPMPQNYQPQPPLDPHQFAIAVPAPAPPPVVHSTPPQPYTPPPVATAQAAIAAATGAPAAEDAEAVTLSRAYRAHDDTVQRIAFRKPTGADLRKFGYPIRQLLNPDTGRVESIEINAAIASKYVVALSSPPVPPSTIDAMDLHDADACYGAIVRFFMR